MQGTWCNALFVQAVADCQNVAIHIKEPRENFAGETLIEPAHYLAQHSPTTIYLGHLDELHYVSTAAVTCGSDALENQHSTFLRSTEQDVLFKQPQNSSPKRKRDAYRKKVKTSESLRCQLTSYEKNQNTQCQSEYNKGMTPGWPAGFSVTQMLVRDALSLAEKLKRDAKRHGERVLSDAHGLGW